MFCPHALCFFKSWDQTWRSRLTFGTGFWSNYHHRGCLTVLGGFIGATFLSVLFLTFIFCLCIIIHAIVVISFSSSFVFSELFFGSVGLGILGWISVWVLALAKFIELINSSYILLSFNFVCRILLMLVLLMLILLPSSPFTPPNPLSKLIY